MNLKRKKKEINDIHAQEIQKQLMFMKQRYNEAGSKSAKLLAYRLKKQQANNSIYKIRDSHTKSTIYKTEDIHNCFETYYKKLYAQPMVNNKVQMDLLLESLNLQRVTEEQNMAHSRNYSRGNKHSNFKTKGEQVPGYGWVHLRMVLITQGIIDPFATECI